MAWGIQNPIFKSWDFEGPDFRFQLYNYVYANQMLDWTVQSPKNYFYLKWANLTILWGFLRGSVKYP